MTVKVSKRDRYPDFVKAVNRLTKRQVLIGFPADGAARKPEEGDTHPPAVNSLIGYVLETGSPARNIPARPFLVPGVKSAQDQVADRLQKGAVAVMNGNPEAADKTLDAVGLMGVSAVQRYMTSGQFQPLSDGTIEARARRGRKGAKQYLKLKSEGVPTDVLAGAELVKPLIDTGQLRRAVTYVIRDTKGDGS